MKKSIPNLSAFILIFIGLVVFSTPGIECSQEDPAAKLLGEWIVAGKYGTGDGEAVFKADMTYSLKETHPDGMTVTHTGEYRIDSSVEPCAIDLCPGKFSNPGSEWVTTFGILRFISDTVNAAHKQKIWAGICGEMPGSVYGALLLLGLGLDEFSASSYLIPEIKKIIRSVTFDETRALVRKALKLSTADEVKNLLDKHIDNKRPELKGFIPETLK